MLTAIQLNRVRAAQRSLKNMQRSTTTRRLPDLPHVDISSLWAIALVIRPLALILSVVQHLAGFELFGQPLRDYNSARKITLDDTMTDPLLTRYSETASA